MEKKKYIYKITNKLNGMVYIGQAEDVERRWREHCLESATDRRNTYLYNAMKKYGINNFKIETIDGPTNNYNEREKYWISYYESYSDKTKGYNMTIGGEDPPVLKGEDSFLAKYDNETLRNIQSDLSNNNIPLADISKRYNISMEYLSLINRGVSRHNDELEYPLRIHGNERKSKQIVYDITYLLLYSTKPIEQIARELHVNSNTIYSVNRGEHWHCKQLLHYPIRQPFCHISTYLIENIYNDLLSDKLKLSEIERKYALSKSTINRINQGKIYKNNSFSYPLRPSNKRVYHN